MKYAWISIIVQSFHVSRGENVTTSHNFLVPRFQLQPNMKNWRLLPPPPALLPLSGIMLHYSKRLEEVVYSLLRLKVCLLLLVSACSRLLHHPSLLWRGF